MPNVLVLMLDSDFQLDGGTYATLQAMLDARYHCETHVLIDARDVVRWTDSCYWPMIGVALDRWKATRGLNVRLGLAVQQNRVAMLKAAGVDNKVSLFTDRETPLSSEEWPLMVVSPAPAPASDPEICPRCRRLL